MKAVLGLPLLLRAPGPRDDYIELSQPPAALPPGASMTHSASTCPISGRPLRGQPRIAGNGHWVLNMSDPNGLRVEFMEPQAAKREP